METHPKTSAQFGNCQMTVLLARCLTGFIRGYQILLSPWLGQHCRFHPSCSHYAIEAIESFGPLKGSLLALRRLGKCHPWHAGGFDPVPPHSEIEHKKLVNK